MDTKDYDDPEVEAQWLAEQRESVEHYLKEECVLHGSVASKPAWFLAPYVSIWTSDSVRYPGSVGYWIICGNLPTDYLGGDDAQTPREAIGRFANRWFEVSEYMLRGEEHPTVKIGNAENRRELGDLLRRRAEILKDWVEDDNMGWDYFSSLP
jgi:hypothetical protein